MKDFQNEITAYALKNAIEFRKAEPSKILPKLFQYGLKKEEIGKIMPLIEKIVNEINQISNEEKEKRFNEYKKYLKEKKEEKEGALPELPNISDNMKFRLAPYPSGALHIGNAKTYILNALYAQKYNAKLIFVMDDTIGSEEKQISEEAYNLIPEAFDWLNVKYEKPIIYKSDRLEIYYKYGEQLIKDGKAYVCNCSQEELRERRKKGIECNCRKIESDEQLKRWKKMFTAKEGEMVVRLKTDMQHPNPAFRDRVLFKISERKHPRVGNKFRVWPTLEMSWAIDDYLLGVTHIIRGNDLMIETDMERFIWDIFKWKHPEIIHTALIRIEGIGAKISKSKAQKEVKSGEFIGWDDPRTWSIQSLKRRGFQKEAIIEFVKSLGLNNRDLIVPIESLYAINRKIIDDKANRYFFIQNPKKLFIRNAPKIITKIPLHPDNPKKGFRTIKTNGEFYVDKSDLDKIKKEKIKFLRLMHLYNVEIKGRFFDFHSTEINKELSAQMIHWLPADWKNIKKLVMIRILMPEGKWIDGFAEEEISKIKKDEIIQFERFGFCRFDNIKEIKEGKVYEFWFSHK